MTATAAARSHRALPTADCVNGVSRAASVTKCVTSTITIAMAASRPDPHRNTANVSIRPARPPGAITVDPSTLAMIVPRSASATAPNASKIICSGRARLHSKLPAANTASANAKGRQAMSGS